MTNTPLGHLLDTCELIVEQNFIGGGCFLVDCFCELTRQFTDILRKLSEVLEKARLRVRGLKCSKGPVATVGSPRAVGGHNPEMVRGAPGQPRDVRADSLIRVPCHDLRGAGGSVAGCGTILEIDRGGQPVRINCSIECR